MEVMEQEHPPRTMKELENRIFKAGEEWRAEHTETKVNETTGDVTEKVAMPQTFTVAKNTERDCHIYFYQQEQYT